MKYEEIPEQLRKWISPAGDCWLWTGAVRDNSRKHKQPAVHFGGRFLLVNRLMLHIATGFDLDSKKLVCHKPECNFSLCVNPAHLYEGTALDNAGDRVRTRKEDNVKIFCEKGHTLSISPTTGRRYCIKCKNEQRDAWRKRKKDAMQTLPK